MKKLLILLLFITVLSKAQEKGISGPGVSNKYMKVPSMVNYAVPDNFSMLAWIKPATTILANEGVFCTNITTSATNLVFLNYTQNKNPTGNYLQWRVYGPTGVNIVATTLRRDIRDHFRDGHENKTYLTSLTCSYNGTNYTYKCYLNDSLISTTVSASKPATFSNFAFFTEQNVAARWGKTQLGDFKFYNSCLSHAQIDSALNYNKKYSNLQLHLKCDTVYQSGVNYFTPDSSGNGRDGQLLSFSSPLTASTAFANGNESTKTLFVIAGNSLSVTTSWPKYFVKDNFWVIDEAIGGTDTRGMITRFDTKVKPYYTPSWGHNEIMIWEMGNDIVHGVSLDSAKHDMIRYTDSCTTNGFHPSYMTLTSRADMNDSIRLLCNSWIKSTYGTDVLDLAANTSLGCTGCCTNTTYFTDGTHMTILGYNIVSDSVESFYISKGLRKGVTVINYTQSGSYIYPNPSEGVTFIHSELPASVTISDINGKTIYSYFKSDGDSQVLTDKFSSGMYFVKIVTDKDSVTHKLIVK